MRAKKGKRGHVWYYLDKGRQPDGLRPWIPLGSSFPDALRAYAEQVETVTAPVLTVPELLNDWNTKTATGGKAGTLNDIRYSLPNLVRFLGDPPAPLDEIEPIHIRQYLDWRVAEAKKAKHEQNAKRIEADKKPLASKRYRAAHSGAAHILSTVALMQVTYRAACRGHPASRARQARPHAHTGHGATRAAA